jgi:hypothetical protein
MLPRVLVGQYLLRVTTQYLENYRLKKYGIFGILSFYIKPITTFAAMTENLVFYII